MNAICGLVLKVTRSYSNSSKKCASVIEDASKSLRWALAWADLRSPPPLRFKRVA